MNALDDFRLAVGFLTRVPVGRVERAVHGLAGPSAYFPLVGAFVAIAGWLAWLGADALLGPVVGAIVSVLTTVAVTGALHEDGLADTADGLWGGASPQRRLEIMRDSRLGTYGAIALVADLALRVALLVPLDALHVLQILLAGHVLGRAAPLVLAAVLPPARDNGLGAGLTPTTRSGAVLAVLTVAAAAALAAGYWAPLVVAAAAAVLLGVRRAARRRLGGFSGDILGAAVLLTNLAVAAVIAAVVHLGLW